MGSTILYICIYGIGIYALVCLAFFVLQEKFIFIPTKQGEEYEYKLATNYEELSIDTPNSGHINGLIIKAANPKGIIFYLHGNTGSIKRWRFMAEELTSFDYHVYVLDYRGYGKSKGRRSESNMHQDASTCYDFIKDRFPELPVVVYGRSLGTGFAVKLAAHKSPSKLVLETPFTSLVDVATFYFPFIPNTFLVRFRLRSDKWIGKVQNPIAIFHGTKDRIVPYKLGLKLFHVAQSDEAVVEMTTLVGGKHNNLNTFPLFRERLQAFLQE